MYPPRAPRYAPLLVALCAGLIVMILGASTVVLAASPQVATGPVVIDKAPQVITPETKQYLIERDGDVVAAWVFFTDKGVFDRAGFQRVAARVTLTERAERRRARVGMDQVVSADLPVVQEYVSGVEAAGGDVRRTSRWLNAVSVDVSPDNLDAIAALPFVAEIKPVAYFEGSDPDLLGDVRDIPPTAQSPDALTYGPSIGQLAQINVPEMHDRGLDGSGVTIAIMDTGFRKSHEAFAQHWADNRVLAEWDFVFNDGNTANEGADWSSQWNHGTLIWSVVGGHKDGQIYGPAYKANFILCKTEDIRSETQVEEDNWIAALEFADSIGTDVTTTSLGYSAWYTQEDYDGQTAPITLAANTADSLGIVMCNSMGNSGPGPTTLTPPADAFNILAVGAVDINGNIANFSSRGPTYDGRTKPEVCAMGVGTYSASASGDNFYTAANGTSLSTPLVAGVAALMIQQRPSFTPAMIRQAMMETASQSDTPDNTYGWGILDGNAAASWGSDFTADTTIGEAPLTVQFTGMSTLNPTSWSWDFGDGETATVQNPSHTFDTPGAYTVALTVDTDFGLITTEKAAFVAVIGDTLYFADDTVLAGNVAELSVGLKNSQALNEIIVPFDLPTTPFELSLEEAVRGTRTSAFESISFLTLDASNERYAVQLIADDGGGTPPLAPGDGEILVLRVRANRVAIGGLTDTVTSSQVGSHVAKLESDIMAYNPIVSPGSVSTEWIYRCNVDHSPDGVLDVGDLTRFIEHIFQFTYTPPTLQSSDCDANLATDIGDLTYLINHLFLGGPPPPTP